MRMLVPLALAGWLCFLETLTLGLTVGLTIGKVESIGGKIAVGLSK